MSDEDLSLDIIRSSIILLLNETPIHGYGIMKEVENRIGKSVNPSLLYPFLRKLEKSGVVRSTQKMVGQRPKKVYELTVTGKELASRVYKRMASMIANAIEPNIHVCLHCGCKLLGGGYREVIKGKASVFCCVHCAKAYKDELTLTKVQAEKS